MLHSLEEVHGYSDIYLEQLNGVVTEPVRVIRVDASNVSEVESMLAAALVAEDVATPGAHTNPRQVFEAGLIHVSRTECGPLLLLIQLLLHISLCPCPTTNPCARGCCDLCLSWELCGISLP